MVQALCRAPLKPNINTIRVDLCATLHFLTQTLRPNRAVHPRMREEEADEDIPRRPVHPVPGSQQLPNPAAPSVRDHPKNQPLVTGLTRGVRAGDRLASGDETVSGNGEISARIPEKPKPALRILPSCPPAPQPLANG